jgi:transposase-like protein
MAVSFKGVHVPQEIMLTGMRWYMAYPLSYRYVEALMQERGVAVDHTTIQRWVVKYRTVFTLHTRRALPCAVPRARRGMHDTIGLTASRREPLE